MFTHFAGLQMELQWTGVRACVCWQRAPMEVIAAFIQEAVNKWMNACFVPGTVLGTCQFPVLGALEMALLF